MGRLRLAQSRRREFRNARAQQAVLAAAYRNADIDPVDVQYIELHGTGTAVGDPIEASALGAVPGTGRAAGAPLLVGSAKTNVGHLEGAAGIVGLVKTALAVKHRKLPPSLNFEQPNPRIRFDDWNLRVVTAAQPWPEPDRPLLAGVSSFGMGGTNCHVVVSGAAESTAPESTPDTAIPERTVPALWTISGKTQAAARAQAAALLAYADTHPDVRHTDIAVSLARSRTHFDHRLTVVGRDRDELVGRLRAFADSGYAPGVAEGTTAESATATSAFLFAGQGSQRVGMGQELYTRHPAFAAALDDVLAALASCDTELSALRDLMFTGPAEKLNRTRFAQPALFALEVSLFRLVESWGITPDFVAGHSIGEIAAAHVSGVFLARRRVRARGGTGPSDAVPSRRRCDGRGRSR
ncbi:acyltransferase domain-containing protein [Streptomyces sp. AK02-01A]|uniref:acyltransferase domain-containing protein n=1 Tax=Streptomyces sp. AK02-01A TaxID=3028648 RepID=UPI0029ACCBCE|nr:acyltransferase domain-containing protein [Streptomyces sp. AK02-01A]MDX3852716.1 acyltransferase domain-containing protein [Streptomyces sp. AK02-01A]